MKFYTWCEKCGKQVSNKPGICQHCGTPHRGFQPVLCSPYRQGTRR